MVGPAYGVAKGCRVVPAAIFGQGLCDFQKDFFGGAANSLDHFRRIAFEMAFENLQDTVRVLHTHIAFGWAVAFATAGLVGLALGVGLAFFVDAALRFLEPALVFLTFLFESCQVVWS